MLGPLAQGENLQNGFRDLIRDPPAKGWAYQIANMPVVQLVGAGIWRFPLLEGANDGLLVDVLPSIAGADGQAVHWDATLDGNLFASGPHVTRNPWVTEFEAAAARF